MFGTNKRNIARTNHSCLLLLLEDLLVVEVVLLILQNVTVGAAALTRTRGDTGEELTRGKLLDHFLLLLDFLLSLLQLGNHRLALALHFGEIIENHFTLTDNLAGVVLFEPGLERRGIDGNNAALHNGVGTNEFVVGSVVDNVEDLCLGGESYKSTRLHNYHPHQPKRRYPSRDGWHDA